MLSMRGAGFADKTVRTAADTDTLNNSHCIDPERQMYSW